MSTQRPLNFATSHPSEWSLDGLADKWRSSSQELSSSGNSTGGISQLAASLLLSIVNETFLSLPLLDCYKLLTPTNDWPANNRSEQQVYEMCFVDWKQTKIVHQPKYNKSEELLLNLLNGENSIGASLIKSQDHQFRTLSPIRYSTDLTSAATNFSSSAPVISKNTILDYGLVKLTYLSLSSMMSVCGILINIFIILIIVFSVKQKNSSVIRSNNASQNNLLLLQLTFTGLMLASYVLVDNLNIHRNSAPINEVITFWDPHESYYRNRLSNLSRCNELSRSTMLMSSFLSPSPFNGQEMVCDKTISYYSDKVSMKTNELKQQQPDMSLLLVFSNSSENKQRKHYIDFSFSNSFSELIDISGNLKQVQAIETNCESSSGQIEELVEPKVKANPKCVCRKDSSFYDLGSITQLMNVIASVHIWTVAALAYDRYYTIAYPLQYLRSVHASKARTFFIASWTVSLIVNMVLPIMLNYSNKLPEVSSVTEVENEMEVTNGMMSLANKSVKFEGNFTFKQCKLTPLASRGETSNLADILTETNNLNAEQVKQTLFEQFDFWSNTLSRQVFNSKLLTGGENMKVYTNLYTSFLLSYSLIDFIVVILLPLLIITICNINIYRIVKVHERRLSISSGSNVAATAATLNYQRRWQMRRDTNNSDEKSDPGSITSFLFAKLMKKSFTRSKNEDSTTCYADREAASQNYLLNFDRQCNCDRSLQTEVKISPRETSNDSPNIVNRSKRLIARQDSYQKIAKLNGSIETCNQTCKLTGYQCKQMGCCNDDQTSSKCNSMLYNQHVKGGATQERKSRLKRKSSDHRFMAYSRQSSSDKSCNEETNDSSRDVDIEHHSNIDSRSSNNNQDNHFRFDSNGIMNQLKLAGLSFAGIAIQELAVGTYRKSFYKSTSCSLGNLTSSQWTGTRDTRSNKQYESSVSRCSVETNSPVIYPKRSYVSMKQLENNPLVTTPIKYSTKLLDINTENCSSGNLNFHQNHTRFASTIGTKSAAFNIVTWLVLTMLILMLPQYFLVTVKQILKLDTKFSSSFKVNIDQLLDKQLKSLIIRLIENLNGFIGNNNKDGSTIIRTTREQDNESLNLFQLSSVWLLCLCRILFLTMIPLNGWLYGIRSRSLRAAIRVFLHRYISRRQASIEINQRQRSISSIKSRDSLAAQMHPFYSSPCNRCSSNLRKNPVNRCSSFSLPRQALSRTQSQNIKAISANPLILIDKLGGSLPSEETSRDDNESVKNTGSEMGIQNSSNMIRFLIDDYSKEAESEISSLIQNPNLVYSSQDTSKTSSLAGSSRSLISSSMYSSSQYRPLDQVCRTESTSTTNSHRPECLWSPGKNLFDSNLKSNNNLEDTSIMSTSDLETSGLTNPLDSRVSLELNPECRKQSLESNAETTISFLVQGQDCDEEDNVSTSRQSFRSGSFNRGSHRSRRRASTAETSQMSLSDESSDRLMRKASGEIIKSSFRASISEHENCQHHKLTPNKKRTIGAKGEANEKVPLTESVAEKDGDLIRVNPLRKEQPVQVLDGWCKQLKQNLSRLIQSASTKLLSVEATQKDLESDSYYGYDLGKEINTIQVDCGHVNNKQKLSLEKNNSNSSDRVQVTWRKAFHANKINRSNTKKNMRSSLTMNDMDTFNCDKINNLMSCQCKNHHQHYQTEQNYDHKMRSSSMGINSSSSFLKPPNFLKLILDPKNNGALYSATSALSPIKECSSNHSYASSQSSLSNSNQISSKQIRNLSLVDLNKALILENANLSVKTKSMKCVKP